MLSNYESGRLELGLENITLKKALIIFIGAGITICLIGGSNSLWHHNYRLSIKYFVIGVVPTFIFFRKRLIILLIIALDFLIVNVGITAIFHPSVAGYLITFGSVAALVILVRWHTRKHPELQGKDWRKIWF